MLARYNKKVTEFFDAAESYAYRIYDKKYNNSKCCCIKKSDYVKPILIARGNWDKLYSNLDVKLDEFKIPLDIFTNQLGDYRVYYAFLNAYYAVIHYYKFRAKYNLKNVELENALAEWKLAVQPKQNILQKVMSKLVKKNQK